MNIENLEANKTNNSIEKWAKDMTIYRRETVNGSKIHEMIFNLK